MVSSLLSHHARRGAVIAGFLGGLAVRADAEGLQPLETFIASANRQNPDNHVAEASADQAAAQRDAARASYLPTLSAQGVYTRNQFETVFSLSSTQTFVIQPLNSVDAYLTLAVPLINVGGWQQHRAAAHNAEAADRSRVTTQISIEARVTQTYYQLLGAEAVAFAAQQSVEVARNHLKAVRDRRELGTASDLDLQRAIASAAQSTQDAASAAQAVVDARRALESLTRVHPEPATRTNYTEDDLHEETALADWCKDPETLTAVQPALAQTRAAEASRDAAKAALLPTLAAQGQEHLTNAGGFTGKDAVYTLTVTASWRFDFGVMPNLRAQTAAVNVAKAREDSARRAAADAINHAWNQVHLGIAKARAAREQLKAATLAQDIARDRYANGVSTQLEVIQAQRDLFSAAVSQVQADFDLEYARALLRLVSRHS